MENIEEKLKDYRLRKRRQEQIQRFKEKVKGFLMLGVKNNKEETTVTIHHESQPPLEKSSDTEEYDEEIVSSEENIAQKCSETESDDTDGRLLKYTLRVVYFAFWVTLYIIAIELQFGIVFLMFSALAGIYLNTRTGPRKRNEISAYSVFNKNCESIDGTLKAEQFEREIGIR